MALRALPVDALSISIFKHLASEYRGLSSVRGIARRANICVFHLLSHLADIQIVILDELRVHNVILRRTK